ncbi:MAG: LUD domain-containing protein [Gemmatimonadaceae bacterium]|nr:LUD domain-containing protein [Gemmatimonadaceae bacterium]
MSTDARADILARLRDVGRAPHLAPVAHPGEYAPVPATASARVERFIAQVRASGAEVVSASDVVAPAADAVRFVGVVGVAESGAVWVVPRTADDRQQLFLAEHVTLVVSRASLVDTLHDAYAAIDIAAAPFGCFVAGPSKTADIEQTLVIGAHGPLGLTVELVP